jgi:hypothetical protein
MKRPGKPRKIPKAKRATHPLRQRVAYERSQAQAAAREAHLRSLMGLPTTPPMPGRGASK